MREIDFDFKQFREGVKQALDIPTLAAYLTALQYRELVRKTLRALAEASPQWSGYYASSWRVSVAGVSTRTGELGFQQEIAEATAYDQFKLEDWDQLVGDPKKRGDAEAIEFCMRVNEPIIQRIRSPWARVSFANKAPYAEIVAMNRDPERPNWTLRPVNVTSPSPIPIGYVKARLPELL